LTKVADADTGPKRPSRRWTARVGDPGHFWLAQRRTSLPQAGKGLKRIFASSVFFGTHDGGQTLKNVWDSPRFHFFDASGYGAVPVPNTPPVWTQTSSAQRSFWREIQAHPIPAAASAVRALTGNSGCLEFDVWLAWRRSGEAGPRWSSASEAFVQGVQPWTPLGRPAKDQPLME
jgi:hypothetical protein